MKIHFISLPHYKGVRKPILSIVHFPPQYKDGVKIFNRDIRIILFGKTYHIIFGQSQKENKK